MKHLSTLVDTLLIYAISWTGLEIHQLPERPEPRRKARWRPRFAHP